MENLLKKVRKIEDYFSKFEQIMLERGNEPKYPISSLPNFNRKIWGLREGITVVGARTSQGKTSFVCTVAYDLADRGIHTLFISLETSVYGVIERIFSRVMKISNYDLLTGKFPRYKDKWDTFVKQMSKTPLMITSEIGTTWQELNKIISLLDPVPKVVIIDFIQNIACPTKEMRETLNEYIRQFSELCIKHNFCGILCSQMGREGLSTSTKPKLHQLRETSALENKAETVLLLHYPYHYSYNEEEISNFTITVAKQRNGRTGEVNLYFYPETYTFQEEPKETWANKEHGVKNET